MSESMNTEDPLHPGLTLCDTVLQRIADNLERPPSRGGWVPYPAENFVGGAADLTVCR